MQRVSRAEVTVEGTVCGIIDAGLLILLGVRSDDTREDAEYLARKIAGLRIFDDADGKLNLSLTDTGGAALIVSQFTVYGDCRKGRRPDYSDAAPPEAARELYEYFSNCMRQAGIRIAQGVFQATMSVTLVNEGPVTLICESVRIEGRQK